MSAGIDKYKLIIYSLFLMILIEMVYIYVLRLQQNKYFVGKSDKSKPLPEEYSFYDWTAIYPVLSIEYVYSNCVDSDEDKILKMRMNKYGVENVRGGSYKDVNIDEEILREELKNNRGCLFCGLCGHHLKECDEYLSRVKCFRCGKNGHFVKDCPSTNFKEKKTINCFKCGSSEHVSKECVNEPVNVKCSKCGNRGHYAKDCSFLFAVCHKCHKAGHLAAACRTKSAADSICYKCRGAGHFANKCPLRVAKKL